MCHSDTITSTDALVTLTTYCYFTFLSSAEEERKKEYFEAAALCRTSYTPLVVSVDGVLGREAIYLHVQKLWTSMHNSAYDCDKKNLIAPLNSLGTLEIYHVIKTAN